MKAGGSNTDRGSKRGVRCRDIDILNLAFIIFKRQYLKKIIIKRV